MFQRFLLIPLLVAVFSMARAGATVYTIDSEHSNVAFGIRYLVSQTSGNFHDFSGTISYSAEQPENIQIQGTIQASSIDTDNNKRDGHLKSGDFFDVEKYPTITFNSTGAKFKDGTIHVIGDFTMHGVTKTITLPVQLIGTGMHPRKQRQVVGFSAETTILRSEYGVNNWTDKAKVLSDEVDIRLTIQAIELSK